jgi:hypothetical protein
MFRDIRSVQNLPWNINCWKDEEVKALKENCISGYAAVAVAVSASVPLNRCSDVLKSSIFASVGLSSLQLPAMA